MDNANANANAVNCAHQQHGGNGNASVAFGQLDGGGSSSSGGNLDENQALILSYPSTLKVCIFIAMAIAAALGNMLTMRNIWLTKVSRSRPRRNGNTIYALIFHLSLADILVTGFCISGEAAGTYTVKWLTNDFLCRLFNSFQIFSLYLSIYMLVLIGIDRWIAVKYPLRSLHKGNCINQTLTGVYIFCFMLSVPQFFMCHVASGSFKEEFFHCVTHGFNTAEWQERLYAAFTLLFTFLLPLCTLFATYISTFCTLSKNAKEISDTFNDGGPNSICHLQMNRYNLLQRAKMKSLRISIVIILAFIICWTPYYVSIIMFLFWNPDQKLIGDLQTVIFFFGMSNSVVNPLIYGAFHLKPKPHCKSIDTEPKRVEMRQIKKANEPSSFNQEAVINHSGEICHNRDVSMLAAIPPIQSHMQLLPANRNVCQLTCIKHVECVYSVKSDDNNCN